MAGEVFSLYVYVETLLCCELPIETRQFTKLDTQLLSCCEIFYNIVNLRVSSMPYQSPADQIVSCKDH